MAHNIACNSMVIGRPNRQEDFRHEPPVLSLAGEHYFFSGPIRSYGRVHENASKATNIDFDHEYGGKSSEYLILGPNKRFFRCTRSWTGRIAARNTGDFEDYEEIGDFFHEHDVERPSFLYLGPNKTFYARLADGTEKWRLSPEIIRNGLQITPQATVSGVESLWLGVGGAWVAQYRDDRFRFDLRGQYASLETTLRKKQEEEVSIAALAFNITDGSSYACVFQDGSIMYETGPAAFDGTEFERWCEKNFDFSQKVYYY
ncbi:hypothetical protein FLAG1_05900 [Fusarium langsethiae]|uniref:Uncharacterized protein n=1 Tax=Fusarium langsethiae TaxID=179993 RepID=A0A0M9EWA0_FUSLA|nr:hypothetical protein FLAG1_05900 [Fusarium langsethiae]GKU02808.1 unnamed protein product [Fusarium langsethiae]GKU16035.1 unnamed protein product [Fusarium langsethiae]